jgi:hypothetical protein
MSKNGDSDERHRTYFDEKGLRALGPRVGRAAREALAGLTKYLRQAISDSGPSTA